MSKQKKEYKYVDEPYGRYRQPHKKRDMKAKRVKKIPLTQGKFALVDDEDYEYLSRFKWHAQEKKNSNFYAARRIGNKNVGMHRVILKAKGGLKVDHINRNPLDNRRSNLRECTVSENGKNRAPQSNNTSGTVGVYWYKNDKKWQASIQINSKKTHLGMFRTKKEAVKARKEAELKHYGEFSPKYKV